MKRNRISKPNNKEFQHIKDTRSKLILYIAIFTIAFLPSNNLFSQELTIIDTKHLLEINKNYGLDSVLRLADDLPILLLDKNTSTLLIKEINKNAPTYYTEDFLLNYFYTYKDKNLNYLIIDFYKKRLDVISTYKTCDYYEDLPKIENDALLLIIKTKNKETEKLLIDTYNEWNKKSEEHKDSFFQFIDKKDSRERTKKINPFISCNYNCYKTLLALREIKSKFYNQDKLNHHNQYLKDYQKNSFLYSKISKDSFSDAKKKDSKAILLNGIYTSLGEIDFRNEANFVKEFNKYINPQEEESSEIRICYNGTKGALWTSYYCGTLCGDGRYYKLELKEDKLIITLLSWWIY